MKLKTLYLIGVASLFAQQAVAQTPKVTTDTRFARGATMAFGRIKGSASANGGSAIQKRGFCLSETPEPTVDDIVSTKQLSNNGIIYYFEQIGETDIDLSNYYTKSQTDAAITAAINTALADYSTTSQMTAAIAAAMT